MDNFINSSEASLEFKSFYNEKCVQDLFVEQVELNPKRIAIKFNNHCITYSELNKRSDLLAERLRSKCTIKNPLVGIAIERSFELIIAILAVIKSGGVCVPLDATYPENRIDFMVKDSGLDILLTTNKIVSMYPYINNFKKDHAFLYLDTPEVKINSVRSTQYLEGPDLEKLIYILYTSGTTGQPKGVAMPHRTLSNLIRWHLNNLSSEDPTSTLQFSPISFDVSFQEIFSTLCAGKTLVLIQDNIRKDPSALFELLRKENISRIFLPIIALQQLAKVAKDKEPLKSLRTVITAGEQLLITPDIESFFDNIPEACLFNHYGPTETHVVTSYKLSKQNKRWPKLPPIGIPIPNVEIFILDENRKMVQPESTGELYLGGVCLANGYYNRPELTKERFVPNPFGSGLLYKTGDLVYSHLDGNINFLGRVDRQVKIRGFRIELGEIEIAIMKHPGINECVVIDYEIEIENKNLIAYIVLDSKFEKKLGMLKREEFGYKMIPRALFAELKNCINKILPDYMIPSYFIIIPKIPISENGKVDRSALPLPSLLNVSSLVQYIKTSNKTLEEKLTAIWEELLQIKPISVNENFFDLGGHSLLLISAHKILIEVLEYTFPITILFKNPTIKALVNYFNIANHNLTSNEKFQIPRKKNLNLELTVRRKNIRRQSRMENKEVE